MKVFLYDAETEYKFDDRDDDDDTDLEAAIEEFYELSEEKGSVFGILTTSNDIVQFSYAYDNKWILDISSKHNPQKLDRRIVDYEEGIEIIKSVFTGSTVEEIRKIH